MDWRVTGFAKLAVAYLLALIVTTQDPVVFVQAPLHPTNVELEAVSGVAVKVTVVYGDVITYPPFDVDVQVVPQFIPSLEATVPVPVPVFETERV